MQLPPAGPHISTRCVRSKTTAALIIIAAIVLIVIAILAAPTLTLSS